MRSPSEGIARTLGMISKGLVSGTIQELLFMSFLNRVLLVGAGVSALLVASLATAQEGPSFKCSEKMASSVEDLICKNPDLAA